MKTLIQVILFLVCAQLAFATAQMGEKLHYKGEVVEMFSTPLESFFTEDKPRPNETLRAHSSANWRGYVGHWKVEDGNLILTGLYRAHLEEGDEGNLRWEDGLIPASEVLGEGYSYPVTAKWFSGGLRIPRGSPIRYIHMGFESRYQTELILEIVDGKVIQEREISQEAEAYHSPFDIHWVRSGEEEIRANESTWIDGRLISTPVGLALMENGEYFKTRGIFQPKENPPILRIPNTPNTHPVELPLSRLPPVEENSPEDRTPDTEPERLSGTSTPALEEDTAEGHAADTESEGFPPILMPPVVEEYPAELVCRFYRMESGVGLEVVSIRFLERGETIHHPDFPRILIELREQDEASRHLKDR